MLDMLDLSDNYALDVMNLLQELSRVASGSNQTTLPSLRWLNIAKVQSYYSNTPVALDARFFEILSKREIEYLDLSHFYIKELDLIAFSKLCGHLKHLVLKNASIITNQTPLIAGNRSCTSLRTLDIRNMNFGYLMHFINLIPGNVDKSIILMLFMPSIFHLFPNVNTLLMSNVLHKDQLVETNLTGSVFNLTRYEFTFRKIDISNNNLRLFNVSVVLHPNTSKSLNEIDFSGNGLVYISPQAFHSSIYIQHLNLSGNNLNEMVKHHNSDFEILLNPLRKLKVFSLSNNGLTTVPHNMFTNNSELRHLDLSDNFLFQIDFTFEHLIKLQILDLGGNRFRVLNVDMFLQCESISQYQNDTNNSSYIAGDSNLDVILYKNPMECKCDDIFIRSVEWIGNSGFVRDDELLPVCSLDNKEIVISKTASQKTKEYCHLIEVLRIALIVGIVSASILFVCVIIVIIWRRRLNKKNALGRFVKKIKVGNKLKNLIFLSFCKEDGDNVLESIFPRMKEEASLALECDRNLVCCGEFNFKPGVSVCIEVMRCIEESAVIIFVVSKTFCQKSWCKMEVDTANAMRKPAILLMLETVKLEDMTPCILKLFNRYTRASWVRDQNGGHPHPPWPVLIKYVLELGSSFNVENQTREEYMSEQYDADSNVNDVSI
ncbi:hypothetical protein DPMN_140023 [Dreissena polymorpha]|uniref:TIR domain-containing protein n=1 Tax=Dreissena polymorpha TaxID=45954 RepID=A0A9D4JG96_DREPO|nr:hypothetical protein DPMN_140023 [Dreissena polymorpha]